MSDEHDWIHWYQHHEPSTANRSWVNVTSSGLMAAALRAGVVQSVVIYDPQEEWSLPNVVTLCALHDAVPLPAECADRGAAADPDASSWRSPLLRRTSCPSMFSAWAARLSALTLVADVRGRWHDEVAATRFGLEQLLPRCNDHTEQVAIQVPNLLQRGFLTDFLVARRLFTFYLR